MFKISKKQLMIILILSALIILFHSLNALLLAKDSEMFMEFKALAGDDVTVDDYVIFHLMNLFRGVIVFMVLSLYTFLGRERLRIGKLYKIIFGGLIFLTIVNNFIGHHFRTVLSYGIIVFQVILFFYIINLTEEEEDGKV